MSKTFLCSACNKQFTLTDKEWKVEEGARALVDFTDKLAGIPSYMSPPSDHMTCKLCNKLVKVTPVSSGCFIATAACGTDQAEDVVRLREFRERVLRPSTWGQIFIATYELCSPPLANLIGRSSWSRALVRRTIVRPARFVADWVTRKECA